MQPRHAGFAEKAQAIMAQAPFVQWLGIRLTRIEPGDCEAVLAIRPDHLQQDGFVHAGVVATLADHTAGAAAGTLVAADETILSIEYKINLLRPAVGTVLRCRGVVLRQGRTISVAEAEVFAGTPEKLVAKATVTLAVVSQAGLASRQVGPSSEETR